MSAESPILAICIPTFNRARYLASLLEHLETELANFPYPFEIIISDNASPDETGQLVRSWSEKLPIRYFRQDANVGPYRNTAFALERSQSTFSLYLADDDLLDADGLRSAIEKLLHDPEAVVVYAPWTLVDLVQDKTLTNFYDIPADTTIVRGNFLHLLLLILQNHVFAEISVVRTQAFRMLLPRENDLAYWSFTIPAEYLTIGKVLFQKQPFYKSVTGYFADERREQGGIAAVEILWDRYRGGLEYLLGLALPSLKDSDLPLVRDNIREFIVNRMLVALRIRISRGGNPLETYYLAARLRGLGAASRLPKPLDSIRGEAALWFLCHDSTLLDGAERIAVVGAFDASVTEYLKTVSDLEVVQHDTMPPDLANAIVLRKGSMDPHEAAMHELESAGNKIVFETMLLNKFL